MQMSETPCRLTPPEPRDARVAGVRPAPALASFPPRLLPGRLAGRLPRHHERSARGRAAASAGDIASDSPLRTRLALAAQADLGTPSTRPRGRPLSSAPAPPPAGAGPPGRRSSTTSTRAKRPRPQASGWAARRGSPWARPSTCGSMAKTLAGEVLTPASIDATVSPAHRDLGEEEPGMRKSTFSSSMSDSVTQPPTAT